MKKETLEFINKVIPSENILMDEPMSRHTTFRTGGPADCFIKAENVQQVQELLKFFKENEETFFVVGNGSNLLVSDSGYHGIILAMTGLDELRIEGNRIYAGAGVLNTRIAAAARDNGLSGMEALAGIPGTIGGGMCMNAGAYGSEMKDITELVEVIDENGNLEYLSCDQMKFGYRTSAVMDLHAIVTGVYLKFFPGEKTEIEEAMADYAQRRRDKQPLEYPSAGSTFKRPEGNFAGKLIEEAELRGYSSGGAQVSEKHCGFVINRDNATAADVYQVIRHVQSTVKEIFDIELETEVILLGTFE